MSGSLWFVVGVVAGAAVGARIAQANTSSCCRRVEAGARERILEQGAVGGLALGVIDALGLSPHIPGLLDAVGVPT